MADKLFIEGVQVNVGEEIKPVKYRVEVEEGGGCYGDNTYLLLEPIRDNESLLDSEYVEHLLDGLAKIYPTLPKGVWVEEVYD